MFGSLRGLSHYIISNMSIDDNLTTLFKIGFRKI